MGFLGILYLLVAVVLAIAVFRLSMGMGWHWGVAVGLALLPLVATFFLGLIGVLISAAFVAALYKAS